MYEIEFLGIDVDTSDDADTICLRYYDDIMGRFIVGIYDCGTKAYAEELERHLNKYYFHDTDNPIIDFVICSHSDQDHSAGLIYILEKFNVKKLYMNRPWLYVKDVFDKVNDGRITEKSLIERLKKCYPFIADLEEIAEKNGVEIIEAFQGTNITDKLLVLSPSKDFYLDLLVESQKTPLNEKSVSESFISKAIRTIKMALETWSNELLREDVSTSAENEMSIIVWGDLKEEKFILVGDAGIRGINKGIDYAETININVKDAKFIQMPHHGGRHNVSPSLLNRLIGNIVSEGHEPNKTSFVSIGKNSDHPKKMVVNAFIRRGVNVYEARTTTKRHYRNMNEREGWSPAKKVLFTEEVEDWKDNN